ncbi:MAG: MBL fold metallo-hydrolase [Pirellulales bacterium]|nr:MBL fold metallo-hydrolase [Pirellulales bacterium]
MADKLTMEQLRAFEVPQGSLTVWWIGQAGFFIKTPQGVLIVIDPYLSNVCEKAGQSMGFDGSRRVPAPMTPAELVGVDLYVMTHSHPDHMDPEGIPAYREAGGKGPYLAPAETWERLQQQFGIPADEITMVWPNKSHTIGDLTLTTTFAIGFGPDDMTHVGYLASIEGGPTLYFTGDTAYEDLVARGVRDHQPDVMFTVINGGFRNLGPAEAARLTREVDPKIVIPYHHDMFHCNTASPEMLRTNLLIENMAEKYRLLEHFQPWTYPQDAEGGS